MPYLFSSFASTQTRYKVAAEFIPDGESGVDQ